MEADVGGRVRGGICCFDYVVVGGQLGSGEEVVASGASLFCFDG